MNALARRALEKLLTRAENAIARGGCEKRISLRFTRESFPAYWGAETSSEKYACHAVLELAERDQAIRIEWDARAGQGGAVLGIILNDAAALARFLAVQPRWDAVSAADRVLREHVERYPVLSMVVDGWRRGVSVRGTSPVDVGDWLDAIRVVDYCRESGAVDVAVRRASAALTADSKRIESLVSIVDALVQSDVKAPARDMADVFNEIGLVKFPSMFLLSGPVSMTLAQGDIIEVPQPFLGLSPAAIAGFILLPATRMVLSVENLTTFNEMSPESAQRGCILLYTGGMPSPAWTRVYRLLLSALPASVPIYHWGDVDAGGFRIAAHLAACVREFGKRLVLHRMAPMDDVVSRRALVEAEVATITKLCTAHEWKLEATSVNDRRLAIEQEALSVSWPNSS
jgi:hypothetical protein